MENKSYSDKLKDPRWQRKRLEILSRDEFTCQICGSKEKTLHVHHKYYWKHCEPWEVQDSALITLCLECHEAEENDKGTEKDILEAFYDGGFLRKDFQQPFPIILSTAISKLGKKEFDRLLSRIALSESLREEVNNCVKNDIERSEKKEKPDSNFP